MSYVSEIRSIIGHKMLLLAGANVILTRDDGFILLQQRKDGTWGLPGGLLEPGESLEETAVREVKEETNLSISALSFLKVFSGAEYSFTLANNDEINVITALYFSDNWSGDLLNDPSEGLQLAFYPPHLLPVPMKEEYLTYIRYYLNHKNHSDSQMDKYEP